MTGDESRNVDRLFAESQPLAPATASTAGSQTISAPRRDLIGHTLGPYRVISLIGEGGMGQIYAAEDPRLGRQVALKLLLPSVTEDGDAVRRFQQEARAASALNHPNIVTVHDFGSGDGVYYIATELVHGRTLRQVMDQDQSPVREILAAALQIAGALVVAHGAGIIHRDIKPENVMLRPDGYVKILDFGLAKLIEPDASPERALTRSLGTLMGTVRYMSPEQARGLEVDARSDLFSLGVVLYEWIAHRLPFDGDTPAHLLVAIMEHDVKPLKADVLQPLERPLEAIVARCLSKNPDTRYQTAQDLLTDLRQVQQDLDSRIPHAAKAGPERLSLELFGNLRLSHGEQPITSVNTNRLQSLLGFLVLEADTPQSREQLAFLLWPESGESQARTNLRQLLHNLRRALPPECGFLAADNQTVQWRRTPACTIDVVEFDALVARAAEAAKQGDRAAECQALEAAAHLYQDDLLRGLYDEWLQPKREHYRQQLCQVLSRLAELWEERCDYPAAIRHAERLVAQDQLRESHHRLLIRLHAANRDRAGALRAYHQCMRVLRRELAVEPSAATRALFDQVLQSEHADRKDLPGPAAYLPPATAPGPMPLVGRRKEWEGLIECWRQTLRGRTHLAVISGDPGIGKSRLAEEVFEWCSRDRRSVARARCYAAQGQLAYSPIAEWLRTEPLRAACAQLPLAQLAELARVLPEILAQNPGMARPHPLTESWERRHFYESLNAAFANAAKPLLLLIDDLQWCDPDSFEWLHSLFRAEAARGILVLGTLRSEETGRNHPFLKLESDLRQSGLVHNIYLEPLSPEETTALASQVAGAPLDPAAVADLYGATKGHPLFIVETVRAGPGSTSAAAPPRIHAVIAARLSQLTASAYELAGYAGAIGRGFSFDLLAKATDWDEDSLSRALDELWQRRIVAQACSPAPGSEEFRSAGAAQYDFTHDRLREVAYAELTPVRRRFLHRRIARALEELQAGDLDAINGQLAAHYEAAGMAGQAIDYYRRAAFVARQLFADGEAASMLRRAVVLCRDLPPTATRDQLELDLLVTRGAALVTTHGYAHSEAGETYARALQLSVSLGEKKHRFNALSGSWVFHVVRGQLETSRALGQQFLDLANGEPALVMAGNFLLGSSTFQLGQLAASHEHLTKAMAADAGPSQSALSLFVGSDVRVFSRSYQAHTLWQLGWAEQATAMSDEAVAGAEAARDPFSSAIALAYRSMLHLFRRESLASLRWAEQASAICRKHAFAYYLSMAEIVAGWALAMENDSSAGLTRIRKGLDSLKATGAEVRLPFYHGLLAEVCARCGQTREALVNIASGLAFLNKNSEMWAASDLHRIHGDLLENSNPAGAEASYRRAIETGRQTGGRMFELRAATRLCQLPLPAPSMADAREALEALYRQFAEGFETYDLREAERQLAHPQNALRTPHMAP